MLAANNWLAFSFFTFPFLFSFIWVMIKLKKDRGLIFSLCCPGMACTHDLHLSLCHEGAHQNQPGRKDQLWEPQKYSPPGEKDGWIREREREKPDIISKLQRGRQVPMHSSELWCGTKELSPWNDVRVIEMSPLCFLLCCYFSFQNHLFCHHPHA